MIETEPTPFGPNVDREAVRTFTQAVVDKRGLVRATLYGYGEHPDTSSWSADGPVTVAVDLFRRFEGLPTSNNSIRANARETFLAECQALFKTHVEVAPIDIPAVQA